MEKKLKLSDIGYYGRPVIGLTKKELQLAFLEVTQQLYNCTSANEQCKAINIEGEKQ